MGFTREMPLHIGVVPDCHAASGLLHVVVAHLYANFSSLVTGKFVF